MSRSRTIAPTRLRGRPLSLDNRRTAAAAARRRTVTGAEARGHLSKTNGRAPSAVRVACFRRRPQAPQAHA
eukprot:6416725-Prymnesium_polylepis.1